MSTESEHARILLERCDVLGSISEEPNRLTRRYGTPAMREVNARVAGWMRDAGMTTRQDAIGNVVGRYEGATSDAPALLLGSHLDTVRDAGKYDGPLGVLAAIALVERLHARGERLPFALEVYGFADEEGLRYHTAYLGSAVVAGVFDAAALAQTDDTGVPLAEALRAFGGNSDHLAASKRQDTDLLGYVEVHIEQGPVLEAKGLPVGIVTAIQGQSRARATFAGVAGHAGTVPMNMRHDALLPACQFALAVEALAASIDGLVATVGQIEAYPGASNVIPGRATLSLDVRHPDDAVRQRVCQQLLSSAREFGQRRDIAVTWEQVQESTSVVCAPRLTNLLARAVERQGYPALSLPSGAGHDAVMMAHLTDVAMLFVRCKGGISHAPGESVTLPDVAVALDVLEDFVRVLAREKTERAGNAGRAGGTA